MEYQATPPPPPPAEPGGLWNQWPRSRILGLAALLMVGDFGLQIVFYSLGGGLFWPVLLGTIGGVLLPLYLLARNHGLRLPGDLSLWPTRPWILLVAALSAAAALAPTSLLARWSLHLHPADPQWLAFMADNMPRTAAGIALAFLTVGLAAPLAEELIFRGLLHRLAARAWGRWPAVAVSSLVFALVHGEPWYLFGLVGIGVVLAIVYEATGSVCACWLTHVVHNTISLAMMVWGDQDPLEPQAITPGDIALAVGSLTVLGLLLVLLLRYGWSAPPADRQQAWRLPRPRD